MLKNIHPYTNLNALKQDINSKDHTVINIKCAAKNYKGILIYISHETAVKNKDIYKFNIYNIYNI